jgi:mono/diheme cytochrome c family protein
MHWLLQEEIFFTIFESIKSKNMKQIPLFLFVAFLASLAVVSCNDGTQAKTGELTVVDKDSSMSQESLVQRGQYLVGIMGCHDCHTPKKMGPHGPELDENALLSGHPAQMPLGKFDTATTKNWVLLNMTTTAAIGPWGASFAANLTSDETGIGNWTEAQFKKALTEGKLKGMEGTRPILPPMPWQNFKNIQDAELRAIFAYLKSTKPVRNIVPNHIPPTELGKYIQ